MLDPLKDFTHVSVKIFVLNAVSWSIISVVHHSYKLQLRLRLLKAIRVTVRLI